MRPILAGIETEYGLQVEDRGAEDQVDDATALVRAYPGERFSGWDYRFENPRADLRGFSVQQLAFDPEDAKFDSGKSRPREADVRADQILGNGARFYNDHGHPEYATPECLSLQELALHDKAGEIVVLAAAAAFQLQTGRKARLYKNNTDFHGASYGTHESYLVPRDLGFERLYAAVTPMLIARQILCGAGKVGAESGRNCVYQLSQRADFFVEAASVETLYRRPLFNTRDEPHADPSKWIRLHVICGDANMIASATARKVGLVKLAIALEEAGEAPRWNIRNPVEAFRSVSRDESYEFRIELEGRNWTTARDILETYFSAGEKVLGLHLGLEARATPEGELAKLIVECRDLIESLKECPEKFRMSVDWAAKKFVLERYMQAEGVDWRHPQMHAFDLEYHNIDPSEGLFAALVQMGEAEPPPSRESLEKRLFSVQERTRGSARGAAVRRFKERIETASWRSLVLRKDDNSAEELLLEPDVQYSQDLESAHDVETLIRLLKELNGT